MPSWYLKAAIQGVLSLLPQKQRLNYHLQRNVTKRLRLTDKYFEGKLRVCAQHMDYYKQYCGALPEHVIELGTGWMPIVPIAFYLCGVNKITTIDIQSLFRSNLVAETLQHFLTFAERNNLAPILPDVQPDRVEHLRDVYQNAQEDPTITLAILNITSVVADAQTVKLDPVDFFISNNTLEHIPSAVILGIFSNLKRFMHTQSLMSHLIDLSDHYSHFDKTYRPIIFCSILPNNGGCLTTAFTIKIGCAYPITVTCTHKVDLNCSMNKTMPINQKQSRICNLLQNFNCMQWMILS